MANGPQQHTQKSAKLKNKIESTLRPEPPKHTLLGKKLPMHKEMGQKLSDTSIKKKVVKPTDIAEKMALKNYRPGYKSNNQ